MTLATFISIAPALAEINWGWLIMICSTALIGLVVAAIVLIVVWLTGGLHDG